MWAISNRKSQRYSFAVRVHSSSPLLNSISVAVPTFHRYTYLSWLNTWLVPVIPFIHLFKEVFLDCPHVVANINISSENVQVSQKVVFNHISSYLKAFSIYDTFQFRFRSIHSTGTALSGVHNVLCTTDAGSCAVLVLLDPSVSSDTIDLDIQGWL